MPTPTVRTLGRSFRIDDGHTFRLQDHDPAETRGVTAKAAAKTLLKQSVGRLVGLQERMWAQDQWSVLLIFQAMDAAGKDSTIKHVMSGLNPQGCAVHSFKAPSPEELDHDFLWRTTCRLPPRGTIGIFNRSYYEEVLIVRVHPDILQGQHLPPELVTPRLWEERYEDINHFERYLSRQGTVIRKFFLHVSREEQRQRFLDRLEEPEKHWKFSLRDVQERRHWDEYQQAYEQAIRATSTAWAPWYVVPADKKWFARLVVASAVIEALESLQPAFPRVGPEKMRDLRAAKAALLEDGPRPTRRRRSPAAKR